MWGGLSGCARGPENPASSRDGVSLEVPRLDAGATAAEPADPNEVRFGRENAKVGDLSRQHVLARSHWNDETASYESEFVTEVLAVEGPAPSRVKIEFRKNENFDNVSRQATPIDGHTYVVDVHEPHVVEAATKAPPSADEIARVMDVLPDLGTRAQIDQVLPDGAMRIGEHRDDIAKAIARILHPRIWSVDKASAALARTENGEAVFQITLEATSSASGMKIGVKGDARVRLRDARLQGFVLNGEFVRPNGEKGAFEVTRTVSDR
jgi:hypothetical protein